MNLPVIRRHWQRRFIRVVSVMTILLIVDSLPLRAAEVRPNILLIYADNLGYGDLGCYGNTEIKSPRIDRLASEGVRCTDFHVVTSSCTPSRGAILTGRYPARNGLAHQLVVDENWTGIGLPHRERILPQYLKAAGYATGCFGKWNIGFAPGSRPTERGFDEFFGCRSGNIHYFAHTYHGEYDLFRGTDRHKVEGYSTELFAGAAAEFIRRHDAKPWFVYLPFNAPHFASPINAPTPGETPEVWQVPDKYLERYGWPANDPNEKHRYLALLTALDDGVGRVLDAVDEKGLRDSTLVIFISDMGAIQQPLKGLGVASNAPFRDGAPAVYEGGVRVPAIFRWPGKIRPATVSEAMLSHLDVLPLCLAAAGVPLPEDRVLDGRDPLPALTGAAKSPHERLVFNYGTAWALREGSLKIVRPRNLPAWELYDLAADPGETKNLAAERPADVARLDSAFQKWQTDVKTDSSQPVRPPRAKKAAAKP